MYTKFKQLRKWVIMSIFNKNNEPRPTTSMMLIIRIAVGGYLEYLAFSLYDGLERPITSSNMLIAIATGVFFVAGLIFIALPLRDLLQGRYEGGVNDPNVGKGEVADVTDEAEAVVEAGDCAAEIGDVAENADGTEGAEDLAD